MKVFTSFFSTAVFTAFFTPAVIAGDACYPNSGMNLTTERTAFCHIRKDGRVVLKLFDDELTAKKLRRGKPLAHQYYLDADGDGEGDPGVETELLCEQPDNYVLNHSDCDDSNPDVMSSAGGCGVSNPPLPPIDEPAGQGCIDSGMCYRNGSCFVCTS